MKCPKCHNTENKIDNYFCHNCGYQFKKKINGWIIFFVVLFIAAGTFAIYFHLECESQLDRNNQLYMENQQLKDEKRTLSKDRQNKISTLTIENSNQKREIAIKNNEITNLKTHLPQAYKTLYSGQYLYNQCGGKYELANCYFPNSGTVVYIYTQKDGYGLTNNGGWIPMSRLKKILND